MCCCNKKMRCCNKKNRKKGDSHYFLAFPGEYSLNWHKLLAILFVSFASVAMIAVGGSPIYFLDAAELTPWKTMLSLALIIGGVLAFYTEIYNLFRIIEREQRRTYEWYVDDRKYELLKNTTIGNSSGGTSPKTK